MTIFAAEYLKRKRMKVRQPIQILHRGLMNCLTITPG